MTGRLTIKPLRNHWLVLLSLAVALALLAGCAKYNTFFNAKRHFDAAERVRETAIREHKDPTSPSGGQKSDYEKAIKKSQKLIDEYPGHSLTDDALFLQAKSYYRLESFRMSIRKFDLLFTNFPATPYMEEALYLQSLNYMMLGTLPRSQEFLDKLAKHFESVSHTGPKFVADFEEITDPEQRQLVERDAFERVQYLIKGIGATGR